ncbi:hypothetical protein M3Y97_00663800 [Aphelenchoides bicaudatus]|nr:hypothetical protein M3Y97_00663800 [Aphelenchoides bicaudatus]
MGTNKLDLSEADRNQLESELESKASPEFDHLFLHVAGNVLNSKIVELLQKNKSKLPNLKFLEIDVYLMAVKCKGPDCAEQLLNGYTEVKKFCDNMKEFNLTKIMLNVTAYNYNLATEEDLQQCLDALQKSPLLEGLKIEVDDSKVQHLLHKIDTDQLNLVFDVELRNAMDD